MKNLLIALSIVATLAQASAEVITKGFKFADAEKALTKAKYTKTGLDMETTGDNSALDFWTVDEGVLIILYSTTTGLVESISFMVMDERPKATRKIFDFSVASFDTETGTLTLNTKKPK
jgi:hypothetical protein